MKYTLLFGRWELGEVEEEGSDFPTFFGRFSLAAGVRENPELAKVTAYLDYSLRVWPLMEADRLDEIPVEEEAAYSEVIESEDWWLREAGGTRVGILVPIFRTDGGINWRLNCSGAAEHSSGPRPSTRDTSVVRPVRGAQ